MDQLSLYDSSSKRCLECREAKPQEFTRNKARKDGLAASCRVCNRRKLATWYRANRERMAGSNRRKNLAKYGVTPEQYDEMLASQGGGCAICGVTECRYKNGVVVSFAVDHSHITGAVRGLLCHPCNRGIGSLGEDPARIRAGADYVERHQ